MKIILSPTLSSLARFLNSQDMTIQFKIIENEKEIECSRILKDLRILFSKMKNFQIRIFNQNGIEIQKLEIIDGNVFDEEKEIFKF